MRVMTVVKVIVGIVLAVVIMMSVSMYMYMYTRGGLDIIRLPGGHQMIRLNSDVYAISKASDTSEVIGPPIDGYAIFGPIIVGHVGNPRSSEVSYQGYFVINTANGAVECRLNKSTYLESLKRCRIPREPVMKRP